jgi:hypothetical protein
LKGNNEESMMYVDVVRLASILDIQRMRKLPFPGQVMVKEGDSVYTNDVIAEAAISNGVRVLNLSQSLDLEPEEAEACVVRELGDELQKDDIIAQSEGIISRLVRAPADGRLMDISCGRAVLTTQELKLQVKAGMIGQVMEVFPEYGAVIRTLGGLVQGVWGNGKAGEGILTILEDHQESSLNISALECIERGRLLAAGVCLERDVLEMAVRKGAAGLIFYSLAPALIPAAMALPIPLIVLGGFGVGQTDWETFEVLNTGARKTVCVNACEVDQLKGQRPEVIIPLEDGEPEDGLGFQEEVAVGQLVRILSGEFKGKIGEVARYGETPKEYETGLDFPSVEIQLENGEPVSVPNQNLVILG